MNFKGLFPSRDSPSSNGKRLDSVKTALFFRKNRMWIVLILFVLILLLFVMRSGTEPKNRTESELDFYEYSEVLRADLEKLLSSMSGVGKCTVLITFSDAGETVYAIDEDSTRLDGGKNSESKEYVLVSSRSEGLVLKVHSPSVSGVAVICEGGDSTRVKNDVTEVLSRTLGISADRISVKKKYVRE